MNNLRLAAFCLGGALLGHGLKQGCIRIGESIASEAWNDGAHEVRSQAVRAGYAEWVPPPEPEGSWTKVRIDADIRWKTPEEICGGPR